jgi:hypothetical protein
MMQWNRRLIDARRAPYHQDRNVIAQGFRVETGGASANAMFRIGLDAVEGLPV